MSEPVGNITERATLSEASTHDELAAMQQNLERAEEAFRDGALDTASKHVRAVTQSGRVRLSRRGLIRRAEELEARIEKRQRLRTNQLTLLVVLLASAVVVGITAAFEVPSIAIDGTIRTSSFVSRVSGRLAFADMRASAVDLTELTTLETEGTLLPAGAAPGEAAEEPRDLSLRPVAPNPTFTAHIEDSLLSLDALALDEKEQSLTLMTLEQPLPQLSLGLGSKVSGEFQLGNRTQLSTGRVSWDFEPDRSLSFEAERGARVTLKSPPDNLKKQNVLDKLTVTALHLLNPADEGRSPVLGGRVRLSDVALAPVELAAGDRVRLEPSGPLVLRDVTWHDGLVFRLSGRVAKLEVNGRSHKPSLLEWSRANHFVLLCSAALASLVSFLWLTLQRLEIIRS